MSFRLHQWEVWTTLPWEYNYGGKINFEERTFFVDKIITPSLYYKKNGNSKYGEMSQKKMAMLAQQNVW